jgi:hypothetical protein
MGPEKTQGRALYALCARRFQGIVGLERFPVEHFFARTSLPIADILDNREILHSEELRKK